MQHKKFKNCDGSCNLILIMKKKSAMVCVIAQIFPPQNSVASPWGTATPPWKREAYDTLLLIHTAARPAFPSCNVTQCRASAEGNHKPATAGSQQWAGP